MRKLTIVLALALAVAMTLPAAAEVEEITVGGSIQIRGQILTPGIGTQAGPLNIDVEPIPFTFTNAHLVDFNGNGAISPSEALLSLQLFNNYVQPAMFDDDIEDLDWITQRTRVNVDAKLSGGVRGFVELQAFDFWGIDGDDTVLEEGTDHDLGLPIMSDEVATGGFAGAGNDLVQLYQAYIEMNDIADYPLSLRIGRQELVYGREWLVGNNDAGINFSGLSFDAVKLVYDTDLFSVDAWASKMADFSTPLFAGVQEEDADIDFFGAYGSWKGIENMVIDGYVLWLRSGQSVDPILGTTDTSDVFNLYTVGGRVAGAWDIMGFLPGMLDYNIEAAFQFGDNNIGSAADPTDSGEFEGWAFNAMAGYTFTEVQWTPRVEAEYAFFSGDDDALDEDTEEFVRLFSDVHYGELNMGGDLDQLATNLHILRFGASAVPVERLTVKADFYLFWLEEDDEDGFAKTFGLPQFEASTWSVGPLTVPISQIGDDNEVGYELDIVADYQYTEDLNLRAGWAHFFVDDALENAWGAGQDDDVDYLYVQALLVF